MKFDRQRVGRDRQGAGMNYMVFTTRHHDGFTMFDSKYTDYKITSPDSPYRKDIVKQLSDACHAGGMTWGDLLFAARLASSRLHDRQPRQICEIHARAGRGIALELRPHRHALLRWLGRRRQTLGRRKPLQDDPHLAAADHHQQSLRTARPTTTRPNRKSARCKPTAPGKPA